MEKFEMPQNNKETEKAPDGWRTIGSIAVEHKATYTVLSKIADKYKDTHPEYFGNFKDRNGQRILQYCSPELVKIIEEEFAMFKNIPESPLGWETNGTIFKNLKTGQKQVGDIVDIYRETNPEYFGQFRHGKVGRVDEYYAPELIEIIKQKIKESQSIPETPDGWKTVTGLSKDLDVAFRTIEKIADEYRETNPDYFKNFKVKEGEVRGPIREHYSPKLVNIITQEILKNKNIPEALPGWKTLTSLYKELNSYSKMIVSLADVYRNDHPDYFKNFRSENGKIYEYYSPELVTHISEDLKNSTDTVPAGWETLASLTKKLNIGSNKIQQIISKYKDHEEYFKEFKILKSGMLQYYSPELVSIIERDIETFKSIPPPPLGWETTNFIAKKVGKDFITITRFVNSFKISNPEYFKEFRTKVGILIHYSPELVKIITEKFSNLDEVPENWKTPEELAKETGISLEDINKAAAKLKKEFPDKFGKFKDKE